jgi:peptidyl-Asp metalloendopeptidase
MKTVRFSILIGIVSLALSTVAVNVTIAQPAFERVITTVTLSEREEELITTITERPTTKNLVLVRVSNPEQLREAMNIELPINSKVERFERSRISEDNELGVSWSGRSSGAVRELYLFYHEGYLHGMIHLDSVVINIEPVNREYVVFTVLEQSLFDPCPVGEDESIEEPSPKKEYDHKNDENGSIQSFFEISSSTPVIDVMVVYTPQSAAESGNIQSLIAASIQSTNETLQNSNINATVNLVHSAQVSYTETGNMETDIGRLRGTNDGYMDIIHSWRDQYGADIVVLLTATGQYCGIAYWIEVPASDAFAISRNDCSVGNYTFAHEIGHLIGGRHDNDPASSPRPYAHGYRYEPAYWRTVMAVRHYSGDPVNRIPYWSNPNKWYGGVRMGTTSWNNNARVWFERAPIVAGFKTPSVAVTISGPGPVYTSGNYTWIASASGGTGSYTYTWYRRIEHHTLDCKYETNWSQVDTGPSYSSYVYNGEYDFVVRVNVQSGNQNASAQRKVYPMNNGNIVCPTSGDELLALEMEAFALPTEFAIHENYPNPFNPSTTIRYEIPEVSRVSLVVYDIMGREVQRLVDGVIEPGYYTATWEGRNKSGSPVASGIYIYRFTALPVSDAGISEGIHYVKTMLFTK